MSLPSMSADRLDETVLIVGLRLESTIAPKRFVHDFSCRA
jgi:hypothetical protein